MAVPPPLFVTKNEWSSVTPMPRTPKFHSGPTSTPWVPLVWKSQIVTTGPFVPTP